jgi:hypothetical protein
MSKAPTLSLRFCNTIMTGLIDALQAKIGGADTTVSRDACGNNPDAVKTFRQWDGANRSPRMLTALTLEHHIRTNLGEADYQRASIRLIGEMLASSIGALAEETGESAEEILAGFCRDVAGKLIEPSGSNLLP